MKIKIVTEFSISRDKFLSKIEDTNFVREEHLFKILVYSPYRKTDFHKWCVDLWKPLFDMRVVRGINHKRLLKAVFNALTGYWIEDPKPRLIKIHKYLIKEGYPTFAVDYRILGEYFIEFNKWFADTIVKTGGIDPDELEIYLRNLSNRYRKDTEEL